MSLFYFSFGSYLIYRLIEHDDVRTYVIILDLSVVIICFWLSVNDFIKRKMTDNQRLNYWYLKERPKGFLYFIIFNGILKWGIPFGFLFWIVDARNKLHPLSTGLTLLVTSSIIGIYLKRLEWNSNKQQAQDEGLMC